jgi:hypothetical protein
MVDPAAAHLAAQLRTAVKDQALSGPDIAEKVERLTGTRPDLTWVSRRTNPNSKRFQPLIRVSPDLEVLCLALGLDPMDLIEDAVRATRAVATEE